MPLTECQNIVSLDDELLHYIEAETPIKQPSSLVRKKIKLEKKKIKLSTVNFNPECDNDLHADWISYDINDHILSCLKNFDLHSPTLIQRLVLKNTLCSPNNTIPNIIGTAPTGSGKTLAFLIPLIQTLQSRLSDKVNEIGDTKQDSGSSDANDSHIHFPISALIMVPTRELAFQIHSVALDFVKKTETRLALLTGGISIQKQNRILSKKVDILISTPGRLWSLMDSDDEGLKLKERISKVSYLVIDEFDRMLEDQGHFKELWSILELVQPSSIMIFSATFDKIKCSKLFERYSFPSPPIHLSAITHPSPYKALEGLSSTITTFKIRCCSSDKDASLVSLLEMPPFMSTIVFVNSISMIRRLCPILQFLGIKALPLHSQMPQRQRLKNIDRIKDSSSDYVLVATDAVGRGIDIPHVSRIIHFQLPSTLEQFVHRSGRTGRADATGAAYLLVSPEDHNQFISLFTKNSKIKEDLTLETRLWEPVLLSKIKRRLELATFVDSFEHANRKQRSTDTLINLVEEYEVTSPKEISNRKSKNVKSSVENEEERVHRQMTTAKISKMKCLLQTLNRK